MKILNYTIIFLALLAILFIWSCNSSLKSDDTIPPRISNLRFNIGDTIIYKKSIGEDGSVDYDTLYFNDSLNDITIKPDTLVIGHPVKLNAYFEDDGDGLSAVQIRIWGDTFLVSDTRIYYRLTKSPIINMFGKASHTASGVQLESSLPGTMSDRNDGGISKIIVRTVEAEEINSGEMEIGYFFSARCIDTAGNEDSVTYEKYPVYILSRQDVLDARGIEEATEAIEEE